MSRNEDKKLAKFFPKQQPPKENPLDNFSKTWYLDTWYEKLIFVLGFLAIIWKVIDLFLGRLL